MVSVLITLVLISFIMSYCTIAEGVSNPKKHIIGITLTSVITTPINLVAIVAAMTFAIIAVVGLIIGYVFLVVLRLLMKMVSAGKTLFSIGT